MPDLAIPRAAFEVQAEEVGGIVLRSSKTMPPQSEDAEPNIQNAHEKRHSRD
ncbi:MAG TPA: hypothetical protein VNU22_01835 [Candidatus Acidoferrum sp.]|nr:hypothetical protein [Candidatus Acidoferrum sp.]